jgi:hypothetical protein
MTQNIAHCFHFNAIGQEQASACMAEAMGRDAWVVNPDIKKPTMDYL